MHHAPNVTLRKGGAVWLLTALLIALIWWSTLSIWSTFLISWATVGIAWIAVQRMKHSVSTQDACGALFASAFTWGLAWVGGVGFSKLTVQLLDPQWVDSLSYLICIALTLIMAGIVALWLISAVIPSVVRGNGIDPISLIMKATKQFKSSRAVGPAILLTGILIVAAVMISYTAVKPMQIIMGLLIAYTQLRFLAYVDRPKADQSAGASYKTSPKPPRRGMLIALFSFHLVFSLFYILLMGLIYDWGWRTASLYPLFWLSGGCIALIAWLFAQVRVFYILLLLLIWLACALVLGMIVGVYGLDMLA